ncbi:VOC family protein [Bacillus sp. SM2101]|uniref:VOC family protein n=1 Tax=Bacillus sp. SM2101 TaxID=2805366 RepID=UPI001BDE15CB|nr:VOC family protein [Bacillus sp. SM2101]
MEYYPMPLFVKLSVKNMDDSLKWYNEVINFNSIFELPDKEGNTIMAHIRGEKYQDILLLKDNSQDKCSKQGIVVNLSVEDVHQFFERALAANTKVIEGPIDQPWNARELILKDPNDYTITLSMQINNDKSMDEITRGLSPQR